jgi:hypothetical protein
LRRSCYLAADDIEPLEATLWLARFELMRKTLVAEDLPIEPTLRHVFHLVQLAPRKLRHVLAIAVLEPPFEALLEAGCYDPAVLTLAGRGMNISVERRRDARVAVALAFGETEASGRGEGIDLAHAFLRAYCQGVIALAMAAGCHRATNPHAQATQSGSAGPLSIN